MKKLITIPAKADIIIETFHDTTSLPLWMNHLYNKGLFFKIIYYFLIFIR